MVADRLMGKFLRRILGGGRWSLESNPAASLASSPAASLPSYPMCLVTHAKVIAIVWLGFA